MGFIKQELEKDIGKFISFEDIILFVQSMDSDKPSFSDTAKFLLRYYKEQMQIDFDDCIDEFSYRIDNTTGYFIRQDTDRPFFHFLEFVAIYDDFECGRTDDNPNWIEYNQYQGYYLNIQDVEVFLKIFCNLSDVSKIRLFTNNYEDSIIGQSQKEPLQTMQTETQPNKEINTIHSLPITLDFANRAYKRFWGMMPDPHDTTQHKNNDVIAEWIIKESEGEITKSMAMKIAQIIRPEWAFIGRKKEI